MRWDFINKLTAEKRMATVQMLKDIDGPGTGNAAIIVDTVRPKEGGILTYMWGYKYPYKGFPSMVDVNDVDLIKKIIHFTTLALKGANKRTKILIYLLFMLPDCIAGNLRECVVEYYYRFIWWKLKKVLLKPERYCVCVREFYRAFTVTIDNEKDKAMKKILMIIRDIFCAFIEMDSAYKLRIQDIALEINKELLTTNPIKELDRLFEILISRESDRELTKSGMAGKWRRIRRLLLGALRIRAFKKRFIKFAKELKIEKIVPDEGDKYFVLMRKDYNFYGMELEPRIQMRKEMEGENWKYFEDLAKDFIKDRDYQTKYINKLKEAELKGA